MPFTIPTGEKLLYAAVAVLCLAVLLHGLRSGIMPLRRVRLARSERPLPFWLTAAGYAAVAALMLHGAFFR